MPQSIREYSAPPIDAVRDEENLTDMVWANAERFPQAVSFRRRLGGAWLDVTARDFADAVATAARGLIAAGIEPGDRVGLLSNTRYEWTLLDFAIWAAGAVTVPIYGTSSADQVEWILSDSGARAVIVETAGHRAIVDKVTERLPALTHRWQIDPPLPAAGEAACAIDALAALGRDITDGTLRERRRARGADDLATIIYTSGTTGRPKGCELTHRNLLAEVRADLAAFPQLMREDNALLLFLPLAHVLARVIALCTVYARVTVGHTGDIADLLEDLRGFRPTFVVAVPRVFEKVYNSAKQRAHADGKGAIFDAADATAVAYSQSLDKGGAGLGLKLRHFLFTKLVYGKLRAALGGRCVAAVSGGGPLSDRLAHFFRGIGVPVFEGYGLTETSAAACVNMDGAFKVGTVGRPVAGTSVRIAPDGEILIRGDVVFQRYWRNEEATTAAIVDGWFHTGDLGDLDEDGFLRITGRKKEILVTSGGKNVAPAALEDLLRTNALISQAVVVGDGRPFIAALITLDEEFLEGWKARNGKPATATVADLADDPGLRAEIQRAIDEANATVSQAESIKRFQILPVDFTEETGELTPSLKLKRTVITDKFAGDIAAIYTT